MVGSEGLKIILPFPKKNQKIVGGGGGGGARLIGVCAVVRMNMVPSIPFIKDKVSGSLRMKRVHCSLGKSCIFYTYQGLTIGIA